MDIEIYLTLEENTKEKYREKLILEFLKEKSGNGTGEKSSKYIYYVESLANQKRVYLKRPALLNKGMDFTVHLEDTIFHTGSNKNRPRHIDIIEDLKLKKKENELAYLKVKEILEKIYNCQSILNSNYQYLKFSSGVEIEGIFKIIKWLFIEQDVTYWNWSGRNMLYLSLKENNLL